MQDKNAPIEFPEIKPLASLADYNELSDEERATRQAAVTKYFVTFAINYSRRVKTSTDYLLNEVDEYKAVGNFTLNNDAQKHKEIKLSRKLVEADELCGTVLDRMVAFCITPGNIENVKDKKLLELLNKWKDSVGNLESPKMTASETFVTKPIGLGIVFEQILERLFVDGDSVISEIWADDVEVNDSQHVLPYKFNIYDTLLVEYDEVLFSTSGQEKLYINLDYAASTFKKPNKDNRIPLFKKNSSPFTTHLKLRPKTFAFWGTSFFKRAFHPVASKKRIEALEVNTIEGLINRLTILKAGKIDSETESGIIAPHRLAILEQLISQPKVNNMLLWPGDDISFLDIGPDKGLLTYESKYKDANEQILAALGFPRVLVDGENSTTENWHKFLGVIAYIDKVRNSYLVPWLNTVLRKIAIKNGYTDEYPRFAFSRVKLHDLQQMMNAVKVFYDRGLMSELSAVTSGDLDYELEKARREVESTEGILAQFGGPAGLPFSKNAPDGSDKSGETSPDKGVDQPDTQKEKDKERVSASINDPDREALIGVFQDYQFSLHDMYSDKIIQATKLGYYDSIDVLIALYGEQLKKTTKEQMRTLFNEEVLGYKLDTSLLTAAISWIDFFYDGYISDIKIEVMNAVNNNKSRKPILPDLIAGIMASLKTKRLRLYSSSVYNKAKSAGELTQLKASGTYDNMQWQSALTERTCSWCGEMHNKVMSFDSFFAQFPPHPECECWGQGTKLELSENTPEKDSDDWSKIKENGSS